MFTWNTVNATQTDADSPVDTTLMEALRQNAIHNFDWIGKDYTPSDNHEHNGTDSSLISEDSIITDNMYIGRMEYYPRYNLVDIATHGVTTPSDDIMTWVANSGSIAVSLEEDASWIWLSTNATTNFGSGLRNGVAPGWAAVAIPVMRIGFTNTWKIHIRTDNTDITNTRIWAGFTDGSPNSFLDDTPDDNVIAFRYSTDEGDTNWMCVGIAGTGASGTYTDSGIAVAADTKYILEVRTNSGEATFYINNTLVATITTPLPSATQGLGWSVHVQTLANENKDLYFRRLSFNHSAA